MAAHHARRFLIIMASCLLSFLTSPSILHDAHALSASSDRSFSFQLHLQLASSTPLNGKLLQHNTSQPFAPFLFSDQPLFNNCFNESSHALIRVGSAHGLYLAHPAASMDVGYLFFTAFFLPDFQGGHIITIGEEEEEEQERGESTLALMGSVSSGAISIIGGTGAFAFANGQAKVSIAAAGSDQPLMISLDAELQQDGDDATLA